VATVLVLAACSSEDAVVAPGVGAAPAADVGDVAAGAGTDERDVLSAPAATAATTNTATTTTTSTEVTSTPLATSPSSSVEHAPIVRVDPPDPRPGPVLPVVQGWAAFDLHLQTILRAGSDAVSATVIENGEVVHEVALGWRTPDGDPVEVGHRYRLASISKVITAITTLQLVEDGLIGLDDPVGARLAARVGVSTPADGVSDLTVRQLLTHRSGIGQYENLMFARQVESCPEAAAVALGRGLERAPGSTFRYSNVNFCLLGLLVEELTATAYADVVEQRLLQPLGISGMRLAGTFDVTDGDVEHESTPERNYMEVLGAAGSWVGSPTDVAEIVNSLDLTTPGWKALGTAMNTEMMTITTDPPAPSEPGDDPTVPAPAPTGGYGMGLMIFGPGGFGHTGTVESTHAMTARDASGRVWAITVSGDHPSSSRDLAGIIGEALRYSGVTVG